MKTFKKMLCIVLSIMMAFSCISVAASAEGTETVKSSFQYYSSKSDTYNAEATLDKVDEVLAGLNGGKGIYFELVEGISVDLRSVTALCGTLDLLRRFLVVDNIFDVTTTALIKAALGQLGDDINLKNWTTGMSRTGDDVKILRNLITFLSDNSKVVSGIIKGNYDMGVVNNFVNLNDILGADGVSGLVKELLIGIVYKDGTPEFTNAYNTYKNNIDEFIYGPLLSKFTDKYLPGFTMNADSTVEDLICLAADISIDKYLIDVVKKLDVDLAGSDIAALKALSGVVNLKGSTYNLDGLRLDLSKPLLDQLNGVLGTVAKQMVPGFTGWIEGGYENIGTNLENTLKYVGIRSGLIPDADDMSAEEIAVAVAKILFTNSDFGAYDDGLAECDSLEEMATRVLINTSYELGTGVVYDDTVSYLEVAGDLFAFWAYDYFEIKDLSGKAYLPGGGKDIFEVASFYLNYFLFDKGGASVMGLSVSKGDSVFTKIDKILDYFGETKTKGVSFDSEEFLLGSDDSKGLLEAIFSYDMDSILGLTVVAALNAAGDLSAVEFLYKAMQYFCNNWAGKTVLPEYGEKAFTTALSNANIGNTVSAVLTTLNSRNNAVITLVTFTAALILKGEDLVYTVNEASVNDCVATGTVVYPDGTVKVDGNALTYGKDFIISTKSDLPGETNAVIKFIGMYSGSVERNVNIALAPVSAVNFMSDVSTVKLVWGKVPCADGYNIYLLRNGNYEKLNAELITGTELYINNLAFATEYSIKVEAVRNGYGASEAKEVKVATTPAKVDVKTVKYLTDASRARFVWTAVPGATHYKLEKYIAGKNKWEQALITDKTDVIISGLESYTQYSFRISALKKTSDGTYAAAAPVSVTVKTTIGAVTDTSVSYTSNSITIKWAAVKNAQAYEVLQYVGGKWKSIAAVTGTSYKATGLKTATKYHYAVRAAVKENGKWIKGGHKIISQYTGLAKPTTFKVMGTNATAAKIAWTKVANAKGYEVFQYKNSKWVSLGITKNTSVTINGLPSGTNSYFKVRAVTTVDGKYHYGDVAGHVTALTLPAKATGLKTTQRKQTSITLTWNKLTGVSGYQIFRLHNGKWVSLGMTTGLKWTDTKSLTKGTNYQYRVRGVQKIGSKYYYGAASDILKTSTPLMNITLT